MIHPSIQFDRAALQALCRKYGIRELCVFGSATRDDFRPESDVDVLVEYEPGREPDFLIYPMLREDLRVLFRRDIDLIEGRHTLVNPFRRHVILGSLERLYAA